MSLCATCRAIDFESMIEDSLENRYQQQELDANYTGDHPGTPQAHHRDIFQLQVSAQVCDLCQLISHEVQTTEVARSQPIVLYSSGNKVVASRDTHDDPPRRHIEICRLQWNMNAMAVDELLRYRNIREAANPPVYKMIAKDPASPLALETAASWLRSCVRNHESCRPVDNRSGLPKRLLSIRGESALVKLVETAQEPHGQTIEWAALSYCWDSKEVKQKDRLLKLNHLTEEVLKRGKTIGTFDPTIKDAIIVARALDVPYIWIDALCINQEEGSTEWAEEAPRMNLIYGESIVTIVAANSESTKDGFLKERPTTNYVPAPFLDDFLLSRAQTSDKVEYSGPWSQRGWTMQEGLLPRRILYYTMSQMVWRCCEERRTEGGTTRNLQDEIDHAMLRGDYDDLVSDNWIASQEPFLQHKTFQLHQMNIAKRIFDPRKEALRLWYELIRTYPLRRFKFESDRLTAISGLAGMISKVFQAHDEIDESIYAAGLWLSDMIPGLFWQETTKQDHLEASSTQDEVMPTWSWISARGREISHVLHGKGYTALATIEHVCIHLKNTDQPFGAVDGGRITITGPFKKFTKLYDADLELPGLSEFQRHLSLLVAKGRLRLVETRQVAPTASRFAALQLAHFGNCICVLLLEAAGEEKSGHVSYRRIGACTLDRSVNAPSDIMSSDLSGRRRKSAASELGQSKGPRRRNPNANQAIEELMTKPWDEATVLLV